MTLTVDDFQNRAPKTSYRQNEKFWDPCFRVYSLISLFPFIDYFHSAGQISKLKLQHFILFQHPGTSLEETPKFQQYFIEHGRYTAGLSVKYTPSTLTGTGDWQHLASGFEVGTRFHSAPVIRLADAKPLQLGHTVKADARWRLYAFAGSEDPALPQSDIKKFCNFLQTSVESPLQKFTPQGYSSYHIPSYVRSTLV